MKKFEEYFFAARYPGHKLSESGMQKAKSFARRLVREKKKEHIHRIDGDRESKRWLTGISGEVAVEEFLKESFMDLSIGESSVYDVADLKSLGLEVGVKTVEIGKFPVIHKNVKRPEIIVVKDGGIFYICGLATPEVLRRCQDDRLILNRKLRARGVKTGFYGFQELLPFENMEELRFLLQDTAVHN